MTVSSLQTRSTAMALAALVLSAWLLTQYVGGCGGPQNVGHEAEPQRFWLDVGSEKVFLSLERPNDLLVTVVICPETPTAFDTTDRVLRAVPVSDITITAEYNGASLAPLLTPTGYLPVVTGGGGVTAYGDYKFAAFRLPSSPIEIDITVVYKGSSRTTTISL